MVVADADPDVVPLMLLVGALAEALASDDPDAARLTFTGVRAVAVPDVVPLLLPLLVTGKVFSVVLASFEAGLVALMLPVVLAERVSAVVWATAGPGGVP